MENSPRYKRTSKINVNNFWENSRNNQTNQEIFSNKKKFLSFQEINLSA
jgi:capsular polysaccharide biosynthesis protein